MLAGQLTHARFILRLNCAVMFPEPDKFLLAIWPSALVLDQAVLAPQDVLRSDCPIVSAKKLQASQPHAVLYVRVRLSIAHSVAKISPSLAL